MKSLNVYYENILVGYLTENDKQALCFTYTAEWLQYDRAIALSPNIGLSEKIFYGENVQSFFENLLPEGDVLDFISQAVHISPTNVFGLLERFGGDTAGAFSILPEAIKPATDPHYLPVEKQQIREWFQKTKGLPLNLNGEQSRMSLSGAQDKMTVLIDADGVISIPLGAAPSTHIIKPSINHRLDIPHTAINEVFIMTLAKALKLNVAETHYDAELCAAIIARYDREMIAGQLKRTHQNDLCQSLGVPSSKKYEAEGGPSLVDCFNVVLKQSSQPAKDKKRLIEWVIFNLLVGNMDSHAKNLSLMSIANKRELTPFYDLVCTAVYPNLSQKFAFKIGGENRPDWIMLRHWERFANDIATKPKFVFNIMEDMINRMDKVLPIIVAQLKEQQLLVDESLMVSKVEKLIRSRASKMRIRLAS